MSYSDKEASIHDGEPIECYEFITSYGSYLYTSADREVTVDSKVFSPLAISRNSVRTGTQSDDNLDIQIEVPATCKLARDCAYYLTPPRMNLTLYRVHEGTDFATDFIIYWKGPIANFSLEKEIAIIRVPSLFANLLAGSLPSTYYQGPCNHVLFDGGCKMVRSSYSVNTTVVGASGLSVQIASSGAFADGYFIGGEAVLSSTGESRMILAHAADLLEINFPFGAIAPGDSIEVTAGCNHAFAGDCETKFGNTINFGGFPYIPSSNPFEEGF